LNFEDRILRIYGIARAAQALALRVALSILFSSIGRLNFRHVTILGISLEQVDVSQKDLAA